MILNVLFFYLALFLFCPCKSSSQISTNSAIHLRITRRHGRFARHEPANLTRLAKALNVVEGKYLRTYRDVDGNRLVRRWRSIDERNGLDRDLFGTIGAEGSWFTTTPVGEPPQLLEFDLDMLSPDFFVAMTTSGIGSKYDTFASQSYAPNDELVHTFCRRPSDIFNFSSFVSTLRLDFATCTPPKSSELTILSSGNVIGLAPLGSLSRIPLPTLLDQLNDKKLVAEHQWSITLLDAESGILSLGGTIAEEIEHAKIHGEVELEHFGNAVATPDWVAQEVESRFRVAMPSELPIDEHFRWTDIHGAAGWWTALIAGVWVNGAKVLKNQPLLFDLQSPFVLAPPLAASRFYESIGGTKRLPPPYDNFFAFPCLNQVNVAFEFGGWTFPSMGSENTRADALFGPAGGRFSLGKLGNGTGYCVGNVVETRMGIQNEWARSGVLDMWVLGEPFFRGLGVVFDVQRGRIGVRIY